MNRSLWLLSRILKVWLDFWIFTLDCSRTPHSFFTVSASGAPSAAPSATHSRVPSDASAVSSVAATGSATATTSTAGKSVSIAAADGAAGDAAAAGIAEDVSHCFALLMKSEQIFKSHGQSRMKALLFCPADLTSTICFVFNRLPPPQVAPHAAQEDAPSRSLVGAAQCPRRTRRKLAISSRTF